MRWEYSRVCVFWDKEKWWASPPVGKDHAVDELLQRMGEEGWELVSSVVSSAFTAGGIGGTWYQPQHWLYFKRPKP